MKNPPNNCLLCKQKQDDFSQELAKMPHCRQRQKYHGKHTAPCMNNIASKEKKRKKKQVQLGEEDMLKH